VGIRIAGLCRRFGWADSLCLVLLAGVGGAAAQEPEDETAVISGRVIDATAGDPIRGATVEVDGADIRVKTDRNGRFELEVRIGQYRLRLSHPDYDSLEGDFPALRNRGVVIAMHSARDRERITGIMGVVTNRSNGSPLPSTAVLLESGQRAALTDRRGEFRFEELGPGSYVIGFTHMGYAPRQDTVRVSPGRVSYVQASLSVDPVQLEPLEVTVERREVALEAVGFYEREAEGWGKFLDREYIEMRAPSRMTDLFTGLAGVTVQVSASGMRQWVVLRSGRSRGLGPTCFPPVYLDDLLVATGGNEPAGIDDLVIPGAVAGVEVYVSSAGTPARYWRPTPTGRQCGVILIWTRR